MKGFLEAKWVPVVKDFASFLNRSVHLDINVAKMMNRAKHQCFERGLSVVNKRSDAFVQWSRSSILAQSVGLGSWFRIITNINHKVFCDVASDVASKDYCFPKVQG